MIEIAEKKPRLFEGNIPEILDLFIEIFEKYTDSSYEDIKVSVLKLFHTVFKVIFYL